VRDQKLLSKIILISLSKSVMLRSLVILKVGKTRRGEFRPQDFTKPRDKVGRYVYLQRSPIVGSFLYSGQHSLELSDNLS